ncbi:MAG: protein BatD [Verrucomicrobia bacterium]|nr:protein BatD [Verrucomicrobiota bacterium]
MTRLISILCLGLGLGLLARGASFTATLDESTTFVGESVTLSLSFEDIQVQAVPNFSLPEGLQISFGGQSRNLGFYNGRRKDTLVFNYLVTPLREGEFTIPSLTASVGGQSFSTQPLKLTVVKESSQPVQNDPIKQLAFVRLMTPTNTFYVGEMFPVEIRLYFQNAQEIHMPQLKGDGFTFGKMPKPREQSVQLGRKGYRLYNFKATAAAAREGSLTLGPAEISATIGIPQQRRRTRDEFGGDLFSSLFGTGIEWRRMTLKSDEVKLKILPLPTEGRPAHFSGAVGQFGLQVNAAPTSLAAGDPLTLRVQISGKGGFDALAMPATSGQEWSDFKVYPPTSKVETGDELGIQGTKTFEQVLIPESTSVRQLPAIDFSYFDPEARTYRTLSHPAIPLQVSGGSAASAQPTVLATSPAGTQPDSARRDIVHIKPHPGTLAAISTPWIERPLYWLLTVLPLLGWIGAAIWKSQNDRIERDPRLRRRMEVDRREAEGMAVLRQDADRSDSQAFFAGAFRLLQDRLGQKLDLPAASITESVIEEHLEKLGAPMELCADLRALLQACDQARFAPVQSASELRSWLDRLELGLGALADWEPGSNPHVSHSTGLENAPHRDSTMRVRSNRAPRSTN